MTTCRRCRVRGRVQGVFFRAGTKAEAERLGLTGWARNLPDGSVEVLACGSEAQVAALASWLWQGPRLAEVEAVDCDSVELPAPTTFSTG